LFCAATTQKATLFTALSFNLVWLEVQRLILVALLEPDNLKRRASSQPNFIAPVNGQSKSTRSSGLPARDKVLALGAAVFFCLTSVPVDAADLKWEAGNGHRRAKLLVPVDGKAGFTALQPAQTGVQWTNYLPMNRVADRQNMMNGAGLAAGDFDGDGLCDLFFCQKEGASALYRNLGGWRFEDVTASAGVACTNQSSTGAVFADLNGDGRLDLLVNSFTGPNACFLNLGGGRFTNVTQAAGLLSKGGTTSSALGDMDGDGDLDLYELYFGIEAILRDGGAYSTRMVNGKPVVTGRFARRLKIIDGTMHEYGDPDVFYLNDGKARFTPLPWESGFRDEDGRPMTPPPDFGLAVQIRDINGDGAPDIYICNDFQTPDRVWLNDGTGRFKAISRLSLRNMSYASMGVDFGDLDRDGRLDFFTVEMLSRDRSRHLRQSSPMYLKHRTPGQIEDREEVARNAFYWNRGDGTYAEIAFYTGLAASDWSWTPICLDVDLDGYEDMLVSNGHLFDVNDRDVSATLPTAKGQSMSANRLVLLRYPRLDPPKAAFRNRGDLTFEDAAARWGFNSRAIAHGMALADLDNDGDQDVVLNVVNGPPLIYRNDGTGPRVAVRLKGKAPNIFGIGAMIEVTGGPVPVQAQEMMCGARYLSHDDAIRTFATGGLTNRLSIKVTWRNGTQSIVAGVEPNYLYEIDEGSAAPARRPAATVVKALFEDASATLAHKHVEQGYDDFQRQPLLPRKFSQLGPGVAWCDLDADGRDDLIVGSGQGGKLSLFRNAGSARFEPWPDASWDQPAADDHTAIAGARIAGARTTFWAGMSSYEAPASGRAAATQFSIQGRTVATGGSVPADAASCGPLALADLDADGGLELFAGGRLIPGRYPEPASSRLFRLNGNEPVLDAYNSRVLDKAGMVSGAVFSDLNGDGYPELILACEWGPLKIFRNERGKLSAWDAPVIWPSSRNTQHAARSTLRELTGLWNSLTAGDFDGDGRMDLVAGNWGLNSFYNLAPAGPWLMYYGDFNGDGRVGLLEAYYNPEMKKNVPWRDMSLVSQAMPWVRERFASHKIYSEAGVAQVLGERHATSTELKAVTLASVVLLNRGDHFEAAPLPAQAQWTPAMGLSVADADGDGNEDLFVAQNFFAVRPEDDRLDAGRGLWLHGDGKGHFSPLSGQESGVKVYGEQRGAALSDYDGDGRIDLVVTQNGAETKLYRNVGARPGLRVRLELAGQADAIGAQIRLLSGQTMGPAREIHAGGGYWSQDSAVQVMNAPGAATDIWVRWPGGKTTTSPLPPEAKEVVVDAQGRLTVKR